MTRHSPARRLLVLAGWFGLAAGLLEAIVATVIQLVPSWIAWTMVQHYMVSADFFWIAPVVNLAFFVLAVPALMLVGALLGFVVRMSPERREQAVVFAFTALAGYVVLSVPDRLSEWSLAALSAGLAARIAISFHARPQRLLGWFTRSIAWMCASVVVAAVVMRTGAAVRETRQIRGLPGSPRDVPNVLLIVIDTLRADHLSGHGYRRLTTPNIDQFAREGALFELAISPAPWTLPTHASLFTGRYPHEHLADRASLRLGSQYETLAEVLASQGFATGGFSGNASFVAQHSGLTRGFSHFEDYFDPPSDAVARTTLGRKFVARLASYLGARDDLGRKRAGALTDAVLAWTDRIERRPFFAFVNYFDVHDPYTAPMPFHGQFMTERLRLSTRGYSFRPPRLPIWSSFPGEEALLTAAYDGGIAYVDAELKRLVDSLRGRNLLDKTLIIITSDHGEALGEHGLNLHGHSLYLEQIHVPMILRLPGSIPPDTRIAQAVGTINTPATILDILGMDKRSIPGTSLAEYWSSTPRDSPRPILSEAEQWPAVPAAYPVSSGWVRSLIDRGWHFIERQQGQMALYRLGDDPRELVNLADTPEGRPLVSEFHLTLSRIATTVRAAPTSTSR